MELNSGIFGEAELAAAVPVTLYTVPAGVATTVTVSFCNCTDTPVLVTLQVPMAVGANTSYLEHRTPVPPHDVLERTGIVLNPGRNVVVRAESAGVSAMAYGFEEER